MFRFILPIILIGLAVVGFSMFVAPIYADINGLKEQVLSYNQALDNSKALEDERDKLTKKYNLIDPENIAKLEKLVPNSVDNIRLILEIEKIALPYGMQLRDVKYDIIKKENDPTVVQGGSVVMPNENKDYGTWDLSFSTQATYDNFINFMKDLERNLRIVDTSSIQFDSNVGTGLNPTFNQVYKYSVKIKTYWLKN